MFNEERNNIFMLSTKDLKELQEFCDNLSYVKIRESLDQLIYEYKQYMKSGTPEECAQRKEWMQMSYEDIMANFNSIVCALRKEVADIRTETALEKKPKKRGRPRKGENNNGED